jgi:quinol monooxygenase YgiN
MKMYSKKNIERQENMSITVNIYYHGENGAARRFAEEMESSGTADAIRAENGNLRYEYFIPMNDPETILLIDSWKDQASIDFHHASPMMATIAELREKYDLHMKVDRFISDDAETDSSFIRK